MLPKQYRLPAAEIVMVARRGKRLSLPQLDVKAWFDQTLNSPQLAISISLKVDKRAVVRNRIRRKLRAAIIALFKENPNWAKPGKYLLIVKEAALEGYSLEQLQGLLNKTVAYAN
jgi:ribonuclease P protein component